MAAKLIVLASLLIVTQAGLLPYGGNPHAFSADYDPNPQYSFSYSVNDAITGDSKSQEESRNGDNVHGVYSLVEPDGSVRTVRYTADPVNGFNAVVEKSGVAVKPAYVAPRFAAPVARPFVGAYSAPQPVYSAAKFGHGFAGPGVVSTSFSAPHASYTY